MQKNIILAIVIVLIIGSIFWLQSLKPKNAADVPATELQVIAEPDVPEPPEIKEAVQPKKEMKTTPPENAKKYPKGKELAAISGYINAPEGLKLQELVGKKVIIVDFWTYSCINCQRTIPYLNDWYAKYKDQGLEIIGVHTPEFGFEKDINNVRAAALRFGIKYPVVLDNDYGTWSAYENRYWPRKYIIDINGYIVYDHIGEGGYEETEREIQKLLGVSADTTKLVGEISAGGEISPEIYFGASRNSYLGNGKDGQVGSQTLTDPAGLKTHILYLAGAWNFTGESATNESVPAKIIYRYIAKNVFFVGHSSSGVVAKILRDGQPLTSDLAGEDIYFENGESKVKINEARLYKLIKQSAKEEHTLEIIPESSGLEAFTFTFG